MSALWSHEHTQRNTHTDKKPTHQTTPLLYKGRRRKKKLLRSIEHTKDTGKKTKKKPFWK